ncbi:MAG: biotin transporter BioY [Bacillota bacterium]|nr:biotin transporter BioY [Bacillota bacterium]
MRNKIRDMTIIALFTVLAIIGGKIVIPVNVIPFTLQTAVCFLTGIVLGYKRALLAQGLYLFMGLAGIPVFAAGGGPGYILQPSFGYLPGMLLAAGLIGFLADKTDPQRVALSRFSAVAINLAGLLVIYSCGVGYLYLLRNILAAQSISMLRALQVGMLPYLVTDTAYAVAIAMAAPLLRRITRPYLTALK